MGNGHFCVCIRESGTIAMIEIMEERLLFFFFNEHVSKIEAFDDFPNQ